MVKRVLVIGGYGNFGGYIARRLAKEPSVQLLVGGRSAAKATKFIGQLNAINPAEPVGLDITKDIAPILAQAQPDIIVHTTGPFQGQGYAVAEACIEAGCHYIDLADSRSFVTGITALDGAAKEKNVLVVSGASSVPCLTAAVIDAYRPRFQKLEKVDYGITAAQQTNRGLATAGAILSYVGKPFTTLWNGSWKTIYGWQNTHTEVYPELGLRFFGNCDIPDLDLFPKRYPDLKTVRFSAGHEIPLLHLGTWFLSWLVRLGFIKSLRDHSDFLLKASFWFDALGTSRSGFHMFLSGIGKNGKPLTEKFYIIARQGHGPYIPCMPAILLAKGLAEGTLTMRGAQPCLDLIDFEAYRNALRGLDLTFIPEAIHG